MNRKLTWCDITRVCVGLCSNKETDVYSFRTGGRQTKVTDQQLQWKALICVVYSISKAPMSNRYSRLNKHLACRLTNTSFASQVDWRTIAQHGVPCAFPLFLAIRSYIKRCSRLNCWGASSLVVQLECGGRGCEGNDGEAYETIRREQLWEIETWHLVAAWKTRPIGKIIFICSCKWVWQPFPVQTVYVNYTLSECPLVTVIVNDQDGFVERDVERSFEFLYDAKWAGHSLFKRKKNTLPYAVVWFIVGLFCDCFD